MLYSKLVCSITSFTLMSRRNRRVLYLYVGKCCNIITRNYLEMENKEPKKALRIMQKVHEKAENKQQRLESQLE